jgi:hypothetical protein
MITATALTHDDNAIDDATEAYGGREEIEISDMGEAYELCPMGDAGHLTIPACGGLRCVHCGTMVAR